jgi:hypothetical protein
MSTPADEFRYDVPSFPELREALQHEMHARRQRPSTWRNWETMATLEKASQRLSALEKVCRRLSPWLAEWPDFNVPDEPPAGLDELFADFDGLMRGVLFCLLYDQSPALARWFINNPSPPKPPLPGATRGRPPGSGYHQDWERIEAIRRIRADLRRQGIRPTQGRVMEQMGWHGDPRSLRRWLKECGLHWRDF